MWVQCKANRNTGPKKQAPQRSRTAICIASQRRTPDNGNDGVEDGRPEHDDGQEHGAAHQVLDVAAHLGSEALRHQGEGVEQGGLARTATGHAHGCTNGLMTRLQGSV